MNYVNVLFYDISFNFLILRYLANKDPYDKYSLSIGTYVKTAGIFSLGGLESDSARQ